MQPCSLYSEQFDRPRFIEVTPGPAFSLSQLFINMLTVRHVLLELGNVQGHPTIVSS